MADPKQVNKVVLGLNDGTGTIGIQATGCDPHFKTAAVASIEDLVALVPEALEEAQARWSEAEQYPVYERPVVQAAQAAPKPARTGRQTPAPAKPAGPTQQPLI